MEHLATSPTVVPAESDGECRRAQLAHGDATVGDPHGRLLADSDRLFVQDDWCVSGGHKSQLLALKVVDGFLQNGDPLVAHLRRR